jgi:hypothetical protein
MKPKLGTVVLGVALTLMGLTGAKFRTQPAPDLGVQGCGANDGKLCQQICALQGCGGCCDWRFYYWSTQIE